MGVDMRAQVECARTGQRTKRTPHVSCKPMVQVLNGDAAWLQEAVARVCQLNQLQVCCFTEGIGRLGGPGMQALD